MPKKKPGSVHTAKNGARYKILANGKARFISGPTKRKGKKKKGGSLATGGGLKKKRRSKKGGGFQLPRLLMKDGRPALFGQKVVGGSIRIAGSLKGGGKYSM
jgi:hypothetical protein